MVGFPVEFENVIKDYPEIVEEYMNNLRQSNFSKYKDIDVEKIEWYYSYGYFLTKPKTEEERMERDAKIAQEVPLMLFDERLEYELSKVRVDVTMKAKNFIRSDRANSKLVPQSIQDIVKEVTKVKMIVEQDYYGYQNVKDSIPELDNSIISMQEIKGMLNPNELPNSDGEDFDLDEILDKISKEGIDSLSEEQLKFLDDQSKSDE